MNEQCIWTSWMYITLQSTCTSAHDKSLTYSSWCHFGHHVSYHGHRVNHHGHHVSYNGPSCAPVQEYVVVVSHEAFLKAYITSGSSFQCL